MSRFVEIEKNLVNVDHIVRVRINRNATIHIYLDNGTVIKTDYAIQRTLNAISGRDVIVSTAPCEGVTASFEHDGAEWRRPVRQVGVTADGEVHPLSLMFDTVELCDRQPGFRGMMEVRDDNASKIRPG